jgi:hypothetical protein
MRWRERPSPVDPELNDVAGPQVSRLRFHDQSDPGRRSCTDDIARQQRQELADISDQGWNVEDHVRRRASLPDFADYRELRNRDATSAKKLSSKSGVNEEASSRVPSGSCTAGVS